MIYGTQIGEQIKQLHKEIYPKEPIANVFLGGNAGMFAIAFAIDNLAQAISKGSDTDTELVKTLVESINQKPLQEQRYVVKPSRFDDDTPF